MSAPVLLAVLLVYDVLATVVTMAASHRLRIRSARNLAHVGATGEVFAVVELAMRALFAFALGLAWPVTVCVYWWTRRGGAR